MAWTDLVASNLGTVMPVAGFDAIFPSPPISPLHPHLPSVQDLEQDAACCDLAGPDTLLAELDDRALVLWATD